MELLHHEQRSEHNGAHGKRAAGGESVLRDQQFPDCLHGNADERQRQQQHRATETQERTHIAVQPSGGDHSQKDQSPIEDYSHNARQIENIHHPKRLPDRGQLPGVHFRLQQKICPGRHPSGRPPINLKHHNNGKYIDKMPDNRLRTRWIHRSNLRLARKPLSYPLRRHAAWRTADHDKRD